MIFSLPLCLFTLAHLLGDASAGRQSPGQQASRGRRVAREVPNASGQCSQCARLLTTRIKEKQELERVRHRFMAALRDSNTPFALPSTRSGAVAMETGQPHGTSAVDDAETTVERPGRWAVGKVGERDASRKTHRSARGGEQADLDDYTSKNDDDDDEWPAKKNARDGPDIVSFSNVLVSRRRRNVLQFQFKPSSVEQDLQNLEVVKARLWILLHGKSAASLGHTETSRSARPADGAAPRTVAQTLGGGQSSSSGADLDVRPAPRLLDREVARTVDGGGRRGGRVRRTANRKKAAFKVLLLLNNGTEMLLTYVRTSVQVTHWQKLNLPVGLIQQRLHAAHPSLTLVIRCSRCGGAFQSVLPVPATATPTTAMPPGAVSRRWQRKYGGGQQASSLRQRMGEHSDPGRLGGDESVLRQMSTSRSEPPSRIHKRLQHLPFLVINTRIRKI